MSSPHARERTPRTTQDQTRLAHPEPMKDEAAFEKENCITEKDPKERSIAAAR